MFPDPVLERDIDFDDELARMPALYNRQRACTTGNPAERQDEDSTIDLKDGYTLRCNLGSWGTLGIRVTAATGVCGLRELEAASER
jgi:hypothetical protein